MRTLLGDRNRRRQEDEVQEDEINRIEGEKEGPYF